MILFHLITIPICIVKKGQKDNHDFNLITVPANTIAVWSGTIASIPKGWQICDGTNNTPDFRDKFIRGANGEIGIPGGSDTVTITIPELPSHNHTITDLGHTHTASIQTNTMAGFELQSVNIVTSNTLIYQQSFTGVTVNQSTGGQGSHENRPAFFEVLFIMRLP